MESDKADVEFISHEVLRSNLSQRKRAPPSKDRSLKCKTCGKKFSDHNDRKKHELIHLPGFNYPCNLCSYRGKTKHYLGRHIKKVHSVRDIKCDYCPAVFIYQCKKDEHMRIHTGEKPYKCDYCPKTFRVPYSLKSHMLIHTDEKPFRCSFCDYACRDNSTLRKHQNNHMGLVKLFNCTICNKSFKHKWKLKEHISELHLQIDLRKHECLQCGKMFKSPTHVAVHAKQVHDRVYATKCPVCGVKVSNRYNLRLHMTSHVDYRPYKCTQTGCNKAFKDRSTLKKHTMIHKPDLHYACKLCDMKFSRKIRLVKHLSQHEDRKKSVICDYCQISFYTKNYLIQHIKQKHTVRQRYICDECGVRTTNKPGMILHLKYGHNENDRECKICHSKYKRYEYLKNHYYRTHNVRYKMVKPYGKKPKQVRDLKAEVKVKMEPVDENFDQINLLDVDKEEIQEDCIEYSRSILNEDITSCVLKSKGNKDEVEFDQFLVTHMFKKSKDDDDNVPEDVNPIELKKSKETIDELLKKSLKDRLAEAKRNKLKALAKRKERKNKMEAKQLEEKKKEEEERKKRDKKYQTRKEEEEIVELEKLRVKYNDRMKNVSLDVFKKKESTKIKYFKAKTNQNTNSINDSSEEDNDEVSFAVKPKNIESSGENSKLNTKNYKVIDNKDEDNEEFSEDNDKFVENNDKNLDTNDELVRGNSDIDKHMKKSKVIDDYGEPNDEGRRKNGESNEINNGLETVNSHIDENRKNYELNDINGEVNDVNNAERSEFSDENDKISDSSDLIIPTKDIHSEINTEKDEENTKKVEINSINNDRNEENDDEDTKNDEIRESFETNDKIGENNDVRRSSRKRKPNKIYEQEDDTPKHNKMSFKTHQCYVCFKLYPTKEELIQHCQVHFDVCSLKTLTKCPICDYVTPKSLSAHLLKKHDIHLKIPFNHIKERNLSDGSKYCYNAEGTTIEVIPSVKILNKNASMEIDKKNREKKDKSITKTKLVRKGKEWIVEKEAINIKFDLLPQFDEKEYRKLKVSDNYIDRMKQIYKLAKKNNLKMAFPCFDCDKICQNLSALKLHNRKHQTNPKPFRARGEVKKEKEKQKTKKVITNFKNRNAKPKPIKNKHKCDDELKKFYETNIRGGDIEFWQFLKIFNKMDRENITEFDELEERTDFGIHTKGNPKNLQQSKIITKDKLNNSKNYKQVAKNTLKTAKIDVSVTKNVSKTKNDTPIPETNVKTTKNNLKTAKIDLTATKNSIKTAKIDLTATKNSIKTAKIDLTATKNSLKTAKNTIIEIKNFKTTKNIHKIAKPTYKRVVMISKEDYKKRIEAKNRLREKNSSQK